MKPVFLLASLAGLTFWATACGAMGETETRRPEDATVVAELEMLEVLELMEQLDLWKNYDLLHGLPYENWMAMEKEAD